MDLRETVCLRDVYETTEEVLTCEVHLSAGRGDDGILIEHKETGVIIENQEGNLVVHIWARDYQQGADPDFKIILDGSQPGFTRMMEVNI